MSEKMISIVDTYIDPSAEQLVASLLKTTFISEGKKVKQFEDELSKTLGFVNPVTVNSGSTALELALELLGVSEGDEVICPTQTFIATALAILRHKATPVFADIQYETGNIDPKAIKDKITKKTKVVMPVHWGGYPCDMDEITKIAKDNALFVVEDAAHALGAKYKGKAIGSLSDITCFSFQAIKHITTGDGGALCCLDSDVANRAIEKRWFGINRQTAKETILGERDYDLNDFGFKWHLNDYAAVLGIANLRNIDERLTRRREIDAKYRKELFDVPGITLFKKTDDRESACWLFGMHVEKRIDFITALRSRGVTASVIHNRIDRNTCFGGIREDLIQQAKFEETQIHIPLHDELSDADIDHVISSIKAGW
jgi:perosamine synthetase